MASLEDSRATLCQDAARAKITAAYNALTVDILVLDPNVAHGKFEQGILKAYEVYRRLENALLDVPFDGAVPGRVQEIPSIYWVKLQVAETILKTAHGNLVKAVDSVTETSLPEFAERMGSLYRSQFDAVRIVTEWLSKARP